jgi:hypothetical protein
MTDEVAALKAERAAKQRESSRKWRMKNLEKARAITRKWRQENPEKKRKYSREYLRKYRLKTRAARIAERKQFYLDNPSLDRRAK